MSGEHAIIRPVRESDLDAVLELTRSGGTGLTNFPRDRDTLKRRLGCAVQSLEVVTYLGEKPGGTPALIQVFPVEARAQ
jgi:arginine/ornithine N-succinyltransferase beta subunit